MDILFICARKGKKKEEANSENILISHFTWLDVENEAFCLHGWNVTTLLTCLLAQSSITKQQNVFKAKNLRTWRSEVWVTESLLSHTIQPPADTVYWSFYATGQEEAYLCAIATDKQQLEYYEDLIC